MNKQVLQGRCVVPGGWKLRNGASACMCCSGQQPAAVKEPQRLAAGASSRAPHAGHLFNRQRPHLLHQAAAI